MLGCRRRRYFSNSLLRHSWSLMHISAIQMRDWWSIHRAMHESGLILIYLSLRLEESIRSLRISISYFSSKLSSPLILLGVMLHQARLTCIIVCQLYLSTSSSTWGPTSTIVMSSVGYTWCMCGAMSIATEVLLCIIFLVSRWMQASRNSIILQRLISQDVLLSVESLAMILGWGTTKLGEGAGRGRGRETG